MLITPVFTRIIDLFHWQRVNLGTYSYAITSSIEPSYITDQLWSTPPIWWYSGGINQSQRGAIPLKVVPKTGWLISSVDKSSKLYVLYIYIYTYMVIHVLIHVHPHSFTSCRIRRQLPEACAQEEDHALPSFCEASGTGTTPKIGWSLSNSGWSFPCCWSPLFGLTVE